ncbi:hypothetical protein SCMC78_25040 [Streptomyces sp. CMC78]|uniref:Leucine export protein LeuE n=4 Tax=Streptomyces TaxID=1883 RepID=A0AB33KDF3_9ACTN
MGLRPKCPIWRSLAWSSRTWSLWDPVRIRTRGAGAVLGSGAVRAGAAVDAFGLGGGVVGEGVGGFASSVAEAVGEGLAVGAAACVARTGGGASCAPVAVPGSQAVARAARATIETIGTAVTRRARGRLPPVLGAGAEGDADAFAMAGPLVPVTALGTVGAVGPLGTACPPGPDTPGLDTPGLETPEPDTPGPDIASCARTRSPSMPPLASRPSHPLFVSAIARSPLAHPPARCLLYGTDSRPARSPNPPSDPRRASSPPRVRPVDHGRVRPAGAGPLRPGAEPLIPPGETAGRRPVRTCETPSMLGVTDLPTYLAGLALIVLLPGPNSLYVLSVAARRGVRTGYTAAAGVWTGDTVLMTLSALGAASLLQTTPLLFAIVKYAGAGYLTWMAIGMLRAAVSLWRERHRRTAELVETAEAPEAAASMERPYRRALVVSLINPKAILFLISFFVQFVDPGYAYPALSFLVLGTLLQLASFAYLSVLIFGGTRLAAAFRRRKRLSAGATSAAGVLFLGFAAKLSLSSV